MTPSNKKPLAKKLQKLNYQPKNGKRWVLVNKKTGRVSSSNNWLLALAACAVLNNHTLGIASLLPLAKSRRLLTTNNLTLRKPRSKLNNPVRGQAREQAKAIIPALAALFGKQLPSYRSPRRQEFCKWIVKSLNDHQSKAYAKAVAERYDEIVDSGRNWRWWLDRLEKMQS